MTCPSSGQASHLFTTTSRAPEDPPRLRPRDGLVVPPRRPATRPGSPRRPRWVTAACSQLAADRAVGAGDRALGDGAVRAPLEGAHEPGLDELEPVEEPLHLLPGAQGDAQRPGVVAVRQRGHLLRLE